MRVVAFAAGDSPDVVARLFADRVIEAAPASRDEFTPFVRAEMTSWARVVKKAAIPMRLPRKAR
ncbi:MAG: hypothetical protein ABIS45_08260 [Burkholderiales bacterium]